MQASRWRVAAIAAAVALVVALWGGYGQHWAWTGINGGTATLWDWLHLLLLPIVVGILPIWLSRETQLSPRYKFWALIALAAFAALVLAGYVVPWVWTGFAGNRLWDWLELLALPVALALTPLLDEMRKGWTSRHSIVTTVVLAAFVAVVISGYVWNWGWTGFRGNTLWNWLQLLLLPLLVPMVVVPALKPKAMATVTVVKHDHQSGDGRDADREVAGAGRDQRREPTGENGATSAGSGETSPAPS
jgi:heme/copper-type cytochrome/quinol oxidase subunit 4